MDVLLPGRIGLVVRLTSRPGVRAQVLDSVNSYVDRLADEPGTEAYVISVDPDNTDVVWLHEWFRDQDAVVAHQSSSAFADLMSSLRDSLAQPPAVLRFAPLRMHLAPAMLTGDGVAGQQQQEGR